MKISVIIPTYKPKDYIWECLDSLIAQTFPKEDFEIVLVLNGCSEPWKSQIESYISGKPLNFKFIHTERGGVSNARNVALDVATGDYVTFIDDDDYVSPRYLEELYLISSEDTIGISYPFAFNDSEPQKQLSYEMTSLYEKEFSIDKKAYPRARKFFSGPWMKLIKMSFIQGRRFDARFKNGEDSIFMFLISDRFKYIRFADKSACYYRRFRDGSAVTTKRNRWTIILNEINKMITYSCIYWRNPKHYCLSFYLTRLLGAVRCMIV